MECLQWGGDARQRTPHNGALALLAEASMAVGSRFPLDAPDPTANHRCPIETPSLLQFKFYSQSPAAGNPIALP